MKYYMALAALLALAACEPSGKRDYDASARCQALGHKPGTQAYDVCVSEEIAARMLEEQRREYEQRKQMEEDWKLRRHQF